MNKCLNCGAEIIQKNGGKERKFCDNLNKCKQAYFNKNKKPKKYVQVEKFEALKKELDDLKQKKIFPKSDAEIKNDSATKANKEKQKFEEAETAVQRPFMNEAIRKKLGL
jgi:hypothetical protein